jgi:ribonuclease HII
MRTAGPDLSRYDARQRRARGLVHLAGVDEVGRGCLAGPVVAAAVVLPPRPRLPGVDDSKKLTREQRDEQCRRIQRVALAIGFSFVGPRVIDNINIRGASLLAMSRAVRRARVRLARATGAGVAESLFLLVDGLDTVPGVDLPQQAVVEGDGTSLAIAAASIIAKTIRDRFMIRLASEWPEYGFERHVGYGTPEHLECLDRIGPCRWHRLTFAPVAQIPLELY